MNPSIYKKRLCLYVWMSDKLPLIEPVVGEEELDNVASVLDSGYMTQGPYSDELEDMFRELVGADHAVTATSCTTGLELALEVFGVGPGDEVIVPDFTHPATGNAVVRVGAEPVLVDCSRETYNIDPDGVREAVNEDTAALLPVSWGGQPLDPEPLQEVADEHGIPIIEDAACSVGSSFEGEMVGSQFDASVFSFHPRKVLATGEGGMVTLDDEERMQEMRSVKNFGIDQGEGGSGFVRADATNYRLSDVLACIGVAQMEKLDSIVERRREIAGLYNELISELDGVRSPNEVEGGRHNYQSYCVYVETGGVGMRDELIRGFAEEDIETQIGTYSLHDTEAFGDAERGGDLSNSLALQNNLLTLPVAHSMSEDDQYRVAETLDDLLENHR